jgi:hypothetical protein
VVIWDDTDLTAYARHREGEPLCNPASLYVSSRRLPETTLRR